ncbi:hypothetical protein [Legionella clemsonensis]|uniref:Uncharacterized protein n=1 Tax=Legionella clemsonensis TaxID=1867846 RepID=A0A222P058_9GAMM|nr:hypothetical protein [Legionella clemsonensis]ASQ45219.1 hypothetical protein clem_03305 [Legionella clemsonensis]
MKILHLTNPQTVNACTLISLGVIKALLNTQNELASQAEIINAHRWAEDEYKKRFFRVDDGEGLLETAAYQLYFVDYFNLPNLVELLAPVSAHDVTHLIENRDALREDGILTEAFYSFNFDAIEAIRKVIPKGWIDWSTITEKELQQLLPKNNQPSLREQLREIINQLKNFQGITIRMEGHTIPLVKRENIYYSYDSLTGDLSSTENIEEMVTHIDQKIKTNGVKGCTLYFFTPQHPLMAQISNPLLQTETVNEARQSLTSLALEQKIIIEDEPLTIDFKENHNKLLDIIAQLKKNISAQANGRKTNTYSQWKVNLLNAIKNNLDTEDQLTQETQQHYIEAIRAVCAQKRNILHFWSTPHSMAEFEELLQEKELDGYPSKIETGFF